jgi:asparagine N-glycosylation enzyme membrane subunit Stt3
MKSRRILAAFFGLVGLFAAYLAIRIHSIEAASSWVFVVFAALFLVFAFALAKPIKKKEPSPVKFVPAVFFDTAIFVLVILLGFIIALFAIKLIRHVAATQTPVAVEPSLT